MSLWQTYLKSKNLSLQGRSLSHVYILNTVKVLSSHYRTVHMPSRHGRKDYEKRGNRNRFRARNTEIQIPALPTHSLYNCLIQEGSWVMLQKPASLRFRGLKQGPSLTHAACSLQAGGRFCSMIPPLQNQDPNRGSTI